MSTRAALGVHDHLRRRHRPKTVCQSRSHAGDERGNQPNTGAVMHQRGYGAIARQTAACWMPIPESSGPVRGLNPVQLMRHSRTHHSRTSRDTHPEGCSGRLATVLPDDRLADMHHAVGDALPPIIGEICLRRMVRASGKECGWTSCRSRRENLGQRRWLGSWCASGAVAGKARQGDCLPGFKWTLGHHSQGRPTRPPSSPQARFLSSQHPQLFPTDADTAIHSLRGSRTDRQFEKITPRGSVEWRVEALNWVFGARDLMHFI